MVSLPENGLRRRALPSRGFRLYPMGAAAGDPAIAFVEGDVLSRNHIASNDREHFRELYRSLRRNRLLKTFRCKPL